MPLRCSNSEARRAFLSTIHFESFLFFVVFPIALEVKTIVIVSLEIIYPSILIDQHKALIGTRYIKAITLKFTVLSFLNMHILQMRPRLPPPGALHNVGHTEEI